MPHFIIVLIPQCQFFKPFLHNKMSNFEEVPHFMIVLIPHIIFLNLSWIVKCLFLRNTEHLSTKCNYHFVNGSSDSMKGNPHTAATAIYKSRLSPKNELQRPKSYPFTCAPNKTKLNLQSV